MMNEHIKDSSGESHQQERTPRYEKPRLCGTEELTTTHLDLRKFKQRDAENMFKWASDEQFKKYFQGGNYASESEAADVIASWRAQYEDDDFMLWCIQDAETKEAVGKISANVTENSSTSEVEYSIAPWARGKGYASEALICVIKYLHDIGIHRVVAKINIDNVASISTAEKAGMQFEGILRDALVDRHSRFYDVAVYSHLPQDWS